MAETLKKENTREFSFSDAEFNFLASLANQYTGIVLPQHKKDMVYGRLVRRLRVLKLSNFSEYCNLLQSEERDSEIGHLVNAITTNLTGFFREGHHFHHLAEQAKLWEEAKQNRIRIWSAACSSGMEPYSIAMSLRAALPNIDKLDLRILATDIDSNMLNVGIGAEYANSDVGMLDATYRRYVQASAHQGKVRMAQELQSMISFRQLNLLENWPMKGPFDAVFCRNVVIYFDKETKQRLFARMAELIKPKGWLYIGHSENLHGLTDRFELVGRTIYRKVK